MHPPRCFIIFIVLFFFGGIFFLLWCEIGILDDLKLIRSFFKNATSIPACDYTALQNYFASHPSGGIIKASDCLLSGDSASFSLDYLSGSGFGFFELNRRIIFQEGRSESVEHVREIIRPSSSSTYINSLVFDIFGHYQLTSTFFSEMSPSSLIVPSSYSSAVEIPFFSNLDLTSSSSISSRNVDFVSSRGSWYDGEITVSSIPDPSTSILKVCFIGAVHPLDTPEHESGSTPLAVGDASQKYFLRPYNFQKFSSPTEIPSNPSNDEWQSAYYSMLSSTNPIDFIWRDDPGLLVFVDGSSMDEDTIQNDMIHSVMWGTAAGSKRGGGVASFVICGLLLSRLVYWHLQFDAIQSDEISVVRSKKLKVKSQFPVESKSNGCCGCNKTVSVQQNEVGYDANPNIQNGDDITRNHNYDSYTTSPPSKPKDTQGFSSIEPSTAIESPQDSRNCSPPLRSPPTAIGRLSPFSFVFSSKSSHHLTNENLTEKYASPTSDQISIIPPKSDNVLQTLSDDPSESNTNFIYNPPIRTIRLVENGCLLQWVCFLFFGGIIPGVLVACMICGPFWLAAGSLSQGSVITVCGYLMFPFSVILCILLFVNGGNDRLFFTLYFLFPCNIHFFGSITLKQLSPSPSTNVIEERRHHNSPSKATRAKGRSSTSRTSRLNKNSSSSSATEENTATQAGNISRINRILETNTQHKMRFSLAQQKNLMQSSSLCIRGHAVKNREHQTNLERDSKEEEIKHIESEGDLIFSTLEEEGITNSKRHLPPNNHDQSMHTTPNVGDKSKVRSIKNNLLNDTRVAVTHKEASQAIGSFNICREKQEDEASKSRVRSECINPESHQHDLLVDIMCSVVEEGNLKSI